MRRTPETATSASGTAGSWEMGEGAAGARGVARSRSDPQAPQSGQRPSQRAA